MGISSGDRGSCVLILEALGGGVDRINHKDDELFKRLYSTDNFFAAWEKFRCGKRSRADVMAYERHLEEDIFQLQEELWRGAYEHGGYQAFTVRDPKERRIHKAQVQDRIVHQALVNVIEPIFERRFIFDSFSCRTKKGTHAAVDRLRTFLRRASVNNTKTVYALKCDIRKFFASVDQSILLSLLKERISDKRVMALITSILRSFYSVAGMGIPLGNLTSQLFANIYLHELDWFVKQRLRERWYLRYCDDFVLVHQSREHLMACVDAMEDFLLRSLKLRLHPRKIIIRTWTQGVDFLGYILLPHCTVLRTKTKQRMLRNLNVENAPSYLGLCSHASSHHLIQIIKTKVG